MIDVEGLRAYRTGLGGGQANLFDDWPVTPEGREACRKALADGVDALIALGPEPPDGAVEDALGRCVEAFNELDDGFICTIERENLCDALYKLGDLCGMSSEVEWVDEHRDW